MKCLEDTDLLRLLRGELQQEEMERIDAHVDVCTSCFSLLSNVMALRGPDVSWSYASVGISEEPPSPPHTWPVVGRRYLLLDLVGRGGMGRVYRAFDRLTQTTVALKRIDASRHRHCPEMTRNAPPSSINRRSLAREFRTLSTLRHPCIVSVFDHGFDADREPYFTMELINDACPLLPLPQTMSFDMRMVLLGKLLDAIAYLHRRGVIHGDLKPSNILLARGLEIPSLRVVDFGLSMTTGEHRLGVAGTLPYMAPELLRGGASSEASDLYALGVLACEMLGGHHPFQGGTVSDLVTNALRAEPNLGTIPLPIARVIGRALSKSPEHRPVDCASFYREIIDAAGLKVKYDKVCARDAYLIAARFTGRERELATLVKALEEARKGQGTAWCITGESGIGKSRLIEELRSLALCDGVLVLRGQAQEGEQNVFGVWRNVLEGIALEMDLDEREAEFLATVVPNLDLLLDREIKPVTDLPPGRMMQVLAEIVGRVGRPLLIVLEDLQWADADSIALLSRLSIEAQWLPMLLVGSHRNDEAPQLPIELPAMRRLRLSRFNRVGVEALCVAMLGSAGKNMELVDLVNRETEGNTYFVIEVFRALAERFGGLGDIGGQGLPECVLGEGLEHILWRRLSRVPAHFLDPLALVAVAGRQLDLKVLERIEPRIDELIEVCAEAGIIENYEQQWQFYHDKLREKIILGIEHETLRALHEKIARGIELVYPASVTHAARLAHHLHRAHDWDQAARAYRLAGEGSLSYGAPGQAETLLDQARAIFEQIGAPVEDQRRVWRGLAQARFALGKLGETDAAVRRVCDLVGLPLPSDRRSLAQAMARECGVFIRNRIGIRPELREQQSSATRRDLLATLSVQEIYVWLAKPDLLTLCTLWGLNIENSLDERQRTHFRSAMAFLLANTPLRAAARRYLEKLTPHIHRESLTEVDHLRVLSLVALQEGRWHDASRLASTSVERARIQRDDLAIAHGLLQLQLAHIALDDFLAAEQTALELEQLASRLQHTRYVAMALSGRSTSRLRLGDLETAQTLLEQARGLVHHEIGPISESVIWGLSALCAFMHDEHTEAARFAQLAMNAIAQVVSPLQELRYALSCVLDVWLGAPNPSHHEQSIREAIRRFSQIAARNRFALYVAMRFEGRFSLQRGRVGLAAWLIRESIRQAQRVGARYDVAIGHFYLARVAEADKDRRYLKGPLAHDRAALFLFNELGAEADATRARAAIARHERTKPRRD